MERGSGSRLVGDHIDSYRDGDLVLLGSGLPHTWLSDAFRGQRYDRHPALVVQFHPDFLGKGFFAAAEMAEIAQLFQRASRGIWYPPQVADRVGPRINAMLEMRPSQRLLELLSCLDDLSRQSEATPLASESYSTTGRKTGRTKIEMICNYIVEHLGDSTLDHATLAKFACMNPSAFSRFFKQSTGRTVTAYVTELRIGLACRLLRDTDDPIIAISLNSGFGNLSNFNRRFRQHRQMTPREYRSHYRMSVA